MEHDNTRRHSKQSLARKVYYSSLSLCSNSPNLFWMARPVISGSTVLCFQIDNSRGTSSVKCPGRGLSFSSMESLLLLLVQTCLSGSKYVGHRAQSCDNRKQNFCFCITMMRGTLPTSTSSFLKLCILTVRNKLLHNGHWFKYSLWRTLPKSCKLLSPHWCYYWILQKQFHLCVNRMTSGW